jgi:hypothetical protein
VTQPSYPQRLTRHAAPGALLKRTPDEIQHTKQPKPDTKRDEAYLTLVRQCPCVKCGMEPPPNNEAAHVRMQSAAHGKRGGMRMKPADCWALPLCPACHRTDKDAQHQIGEQLFWHIVGINPLLLCERLYAARGDFVRMRATVIQAIAERGSQS